MKEKQNFLFSIEDLYVDLKRNTDGYLMKKRRRKKIKMRVEEMIKFLLRPNQRHKSIRDYNRKDKKWKNEE